MLCFANASVLLQHLAARGIQFGVRINAGAYACGWKVAPLIFIGTTISASVSVSPPKRVL